MKKIKNSMLYVFTIIIAFAFVVPFISYGAESQYGSSNVCYTVDDYFYISIPETINVGTEAEIYACEVNIANGKSIYVRIEGIDAGGFIKLQNDNGTSEEINVYFMNEEGERFYPDDNLVAQFTSNEDAHVIINSGTDANPMEVSAGSYSGQVYFSIMCE